MTAESLPLWDHHDTRDPRYLRFCRLIREQTRFPTSKLYALFWRNTGFRKCWMRDTEHNRKDAEERAILTRLFTNGVFGETAIAVVIAWWRYHDISYTGEDIVTLRENQYVDAARFAKEKVEAYDAKERAKEEERLSKKTITKIGRGLSTQPKSPKQFAQELGITLDASRKQLTRMHQNGTAKRVSRGLYVLPDLSRDDKILLDLANNVEQRRLTVEQYLEFKRTPDFRQWEADMRSNLAPFFSEEEPQDPIIDSTSQARLPDSVTGVLEDTQSSSGHPT